MSGRVALFLPGATGQAWHWLSVQDGTIVARGDGLPGAVEDIDYVAVAPADAVALHWAELPDRSPAQAVAAARLLVAEASVAPLDTLHVAVGRESDRAERPIAVVARDRMAAWLVELAGAGIDPAALIPAPLLLPRPERGYVRADFGEGTFVYRGGASGFVEEAALTPLIVGDAPVFDLDHATLEEAIAASVAEPMLNLRQGAFTAHKPFAVDWRLVRRLAWLIAAIAIVSVLITLVQLTRFNLTASALEAKADALARNGLPPGETINDAGSQLTERLARLRGPGVGFSQTAAAVSAAVGSVPGAEITGMVFDPEGRLKVSVTAQTQAQATDVRDRISAAGFTAEPSTFTAANGRIAGSFMVTVR